MRIRNFLNKRGARLLPPAALVLCAALGAAASARAGEWRPLFDEELSQWETYLSFRHQPGYSGGAPSDASGAPVQPVGYGSDPSGVFTTSLQDGEVVLRVSGEIYGCVYTKESFSNYRLRIQVKWGETKWPPREALLRDTGILYHSVGEAGVDWWRSWMLSQEFQIMEGHMGDYWNIASSAIGIRAFLPEGAMNAIASPRQPFLSIGAGSDIASFCLRSEDRETPGGGWTELELICFEDKSLHIVNGHVVMILRNSRYLDDDGQSTPLTAGRIQLQSEAAECYFKDARIQRLDALPPEHAALFADEAR